MLDRLLCCAIRNHVELFDAMLCHLLLFHPSLIHFMLRCYIRDYNVLFEHWELVHSRFDCSILQIKGELFTL